MVPGRHYSPRYAANLLRRHWLAATLPLMLLGSVAVLLARSLPNVYYAQAVLQVQPPRIPDNIVKTTVVENLPTRVAAAKENIVTTDNLLQIVHDLDLYPKIREHVSSDLLARGMRRAVRIELVSRDTIVVGFSAYEPKAAAGVADRLLGLFLEEATRDRTKLAEHTSQFLEKELSDARDRLREQEQKVQAYREAHAGELPSEVDTNLRLMQNTYVQMQGVGDALRQDRERRDALEKALNTLAPPTASESDGDPADAASGASASDGEDKAAQTPGTGDDPVKLPPGPPSRQLREARAVLEALRLRLQPDHPDVRRAERVVKRLEAEAAGVATSPSQQATQQTARNGRVQQLRDELARLNQQITEREALESRLRAAVMGYQARVQSVPERVSEWTDLTRDYATTQQVYSNLLAKAEEARIATSLERQRAGELLKVLATPVVPGAPASPNRPLIALVGLAAGLGLGLGLITLFEVRDASIRAESEVLATLGIPVLAMVPVVVTGSDRRRWRLRALALSTAAALAVLAVAVWRWL
jgi:succinoglycan biosynthesis transport protein ExoP